MNSERQSRATDFTLKALNGEELRLSQFAGRPMVIVNTASKCGFTPQYSGLERVWSQYRAAGLVIIGVPSNDFGGQEPGDHATIATFCATNYGIDFPMAAKVHVRGAAAHPLFQWLAARGGLLARPRWNFYKYLIGRDGELKDWFSSLTSPDSGRFAAAIRRLLAAT